MKVSVPTLFSLLIAAALVLASGCSRSASPGGNGAQAAAGANGANRRPDAPTPPAPTAVPVEVETIRTGPIAAFLAYNSSLEVETAVDVTPETSGLVEEILVEEGDRVKVGQPLVRLEQELLRVDLRESEVNLAHLVSTFRRTEELFEGGLITQQDYDTRKFEIEQSRLRVERARLRLDQATVRSPVNGVVTERFVNPGARVGTGTRLFALMSLDDMIARVHVPGRYLTAVGEDQEVYLTSEFLPGLTFPGWVKRISPVVDSASGTFRVTVGVRPSAEMPPPGLFVNVRIVTDRRPAAVLVPKRAVVYEGGERFVYVVQEGKATKVRLNAGYEEGAFVEALTDVLPEAQVVVLGQNALKDQTAVRVVNAAPGPTAAAASASVAARPSDT